MQELLKNLAHLSGLRDREKMDFALVKLIKACGPWHIGAARLMRAVGPPDAQRWLTLARLEAGQTQPDADRAWAGDNALPPLAQYPAREAAIVTETMVRTGHSPVTSIFPIDTQNTVCSLLEVESAHALCTTAQEQIESVLWIYQNLQGLLDYGEKDALTELLNRKTFDGAFLRAAVEQRASTSADHPERRAPHAGSQYGLAVIDIDHFKRVNDNFGHLIGDEVLLLIARQMRANFRSYDQLYRFGGEEFVVLMRCTGEADALSALARFRQQIEAFAFPQVGTITVSIGFAHLREDDTPGGAFDRADKAVYYAKAHGRNQVCSYPALVQAGLLVESRESSSDVDFF